jgi:hypothetical protein
MKPLFYIAPVVILLSCNKQQLQIDLSESDKVINAEGVITDQYETQYFEFNWSTNLGDHTPDYIDDMSFQIVTDDTTIQYVHDYQDRYRSSGKYQGIAGVGYEFQFSHSGEFYTAETIMPSPFSIDSVYFTSSYVAGGTKYCSMDDLRVQLDSESEQYFGYDIYQMNGIDFFTGDTIWEERKTAVYWVTPVLAAPNQIVRPPANNISSLHGDSSDFIVKIEIYALSNDVGEYLLDLQTFMNSGQANSQFFNPPAFFTNNAYGLAYGVSKKTVVFSPK